MDKKRIFKAYLELITLLSSASAGEVVFRLSDGRRAVFSFRIESQRLFICHDEEGIRSDDEESA